VGILLPSITAVRKVVLETKQHAQIASIELAVQAFKNDYGDYPPSDWRYMNNNARDYSGTQMLTEALLGWDLMGFHPDSQWRSDGEDRNGNMVYRTDDTFTENERIENLRERQGIYLEEGRNYVFTIEQLFGNNNYNLEEPETFVLCDEYRFKKVTENSGERVIAGAPILYYKAKPFKKTISLNVNAEERIYDYMDNLTLVRAKEWQDENGNVIVKRDDAEHPLVDPSGQYEFFYERYIIDSKASDPDNNRFWPCNPDSYLLISAGYDGLYGTEDDITNFK